MLFKVLGRFFGFVVIFGIVKHGRTHADFSFLAGEDLVIDAALAPGPESFVLGKLGIGDGLITQLGIDLHHGQAGGEAEDLRFGIGLSAQRKDLLFDLLRQPAFPELMGYDQSRIGYVFPMAPGLDIAEAGPEAILGEGDHCLALAHLFLDIFGASFGDARPPCLRGRFHFIADDLRETLVRGVSYNYFELLLLHDDLNLSGTDLTGIIE